MDWPLLAHVKLQDEVLANLAEWVNVAGIRSAEGSMSEKLSGFKKCLSQVSIYLAHAASSSESAWREEFHKYDTKPYLLLNLLTPGTGVTGHGNLACSAIGRCAQILLIFL